MVEVKFKCDLCGRKFKIGQEIGKVIIKLENGLIKDFKIGCDDCAERGDIVIPLHGILFPSFSAKDFAKELLRIVVSNKPTPEIEEKIVSFISTIYTAKSDILGHLYAIMLKAEEREMAGIK
ncbi:hypothetical protein [Desulfurobacterium sp.]|uniref:hypothetical protein n=1 Tax=Desulfurobacterium sp. TaxID=2004706 RepID=UPI00261A04BD|nr:hypothetical protein [Desulfurobacterium sp.]